MFFVAITKIFELVIESGESKVEDAKIGISAVFCLPTVDRSM